jgi:hypothetical protein
MTSRATKTLAASGSMIWALWIQNRKIASNFKILDEN